VAMQAKQASQNYDGRVLVDEFCSFVAASMIRVATDCLSS